MAFIDLFGANVSLRWVIKVYGTSQLAKYLPGNIFHLVGRHALGMAAGVPTGVLAKSAVWELGLISLSAAIFGALALPFFVDASALTSTMSLYFYSEFALRRRFDIWTEIVFGCCFVIRDS